MTHKRAYRVLMDGTHTGGEYVSLSAASRDAIHACKAHRDCRLVVQSAFNGDWNNVSAYEWSEKLERAIEFNPTYLTKK